MNFNTIVWESVESLYNWVKKEKYCGWDPYDALNSELVKNLCMGLPVLEILITQFNKYSILNFRPFFNIERGVDVKGMALFAQAYSKIFTMTNNKNYKNDLLTCISFLKDKSLKNRYGCDCWAGHYFDYRSADKSILSPRIPDVITTSNAIKAIADSYPILKQNDSRGVGKSAYDFLVNSLLRETEEGFYLKYNPLNENKVIINASAEGLGAVCKLMTLFKDNAMAETADILAEFSIKKQKPDGSWAYSEYSNGKERIQIDFHQGFMLDGLLEYLPYADWGQKEAIIKCIERGAKFYREKQFLKDGRCFYRYPMLYPTDIHNQAQGIITFSKLSILDHKHLDFAKKIAEWTIPSMQDDSGYFYYQKHRLFTNKIPHMRWGQAWMMLALATFLEKSEGGIK